MFQGEAERMLNEPFQKAAETTGFLWSITPILKQSAGDHRGKSKRDQKRNTQGNHYGHRQGHDELSGLIGHGRDGYKCQYSGQGGRNNRPAYLGRRQDGCFPFGVSHLNIAIDILNHHNGIIHQHTQYNHQPGNGNLL